MIDKILIIFMLLMSWLLIAFIMGIIGIDIECQVVNSISSK